MNKNGVDVIGVREHDRVAAAKTEARHIALLQSEPSEKPGGIRVDARLVSEQWPPARDTHGRTRLRLSQSRARRRGAQLGGRRPREKAADAYESGGKILGSASCFSSTKISFSRHHHSGNLAQGYLGASNMKAGAEISHYIEIPVREWKLLPISDYQLGSRS